MPIRCLLRFSPFLSLLAAGSCADTPSPPAYAFPVTSERFLLIEVDEATPFAVWSDEEVPKESVYSIADDAFAGAVRSEVGYESETGTLLLNYEEKRKLKSPAGNETTLYRIGPHSELFAGRWLTVRRSAGRAADNRWPAYLDLTAAELLTGAVLVRYGPIRTRAHEGAGRLPARSAGCVRVLSMLEDWLEVAVSERPCSPLREADQPAPRRGYVRWRKDGQMLVKARY